MDKPLDILIVGAGISGIAMACELERAEGEFDYRIVEKRARVGGTWDIFTYPGVRSDSEMDSYRFSFAPWRGTRPLGKGKEIREYLEDTARSYGVSEKIDFGVTVSYADWDSSENLWTVTTNQGSYRARFLHIAGGYFNHEEGYLPQWERLKDYRGQLIHPQHWDEGLDLAGKQVIVIGSGATAATLVPELAKVAKVTMLQRSPSHMVPMADHEVPLPEKAARLRAIAVNLGIVKLAEKAPTLLAKALEAKRSRILALEDRAHFRPNYPVWDQRVCRIPEGDLFKQVAAGNVRMVTDEIARFTPGGILTKSGEELRADVVIAATGLKLQALGAIELRVDGKAVNLGDTAAYRGTLLHNVPNCSFTMGYVNESFTLRAELVARFVRELVEHMRLIGSQVVVPRGQVAGLRGKIIDLNAGYVQRGIATFPFVTDTEPYALHNDHWKEARAFRKNTYADLDFGDVWLGGTRAKIAGPADGDPVILIHGIGRSRHDFAELALPGKRVIALDIAGFGESAGLVSPSMEALAGELWRAVDQALGPSAGKQVTLVGNSLGGALAMRMAIMRPKQVARAVLLAPSGFSEEITSSVKIAASPAGPLFLKVAAGPLAQAVEEKVVTRPVTPAQVRLAKIVAGNPDYARTFIALSKELVGVPEGERMGVAKQFGALYIPTDVLWGTADAILPAEHAGVVRALIPHARVRLWEGAGHILQRERPGEVSKGIVMH